MASEPYTDTIILDCNRNSSIEAQSGNNENPAIFTCKQGPGVRLNRGDKVSIHSAFINEIGNTDGTIDVKGQTIKDTRGQEVKYYLTETQDDLQYPMELDDTYSTNTMAPHGTSAEATELQKWNWGEVSGGKRRQLLQPYGHQLCDSSNVSREYVMKDNEMNIQVSYYKTANGENYFHLPRRFDCMNGRDWEAGRQTGDPATSESGVPKSIPPSPKLSNREFSERSLPWAYFGTQWTGSPATIMSQYTSGDGTQGSPYMPSQSSGYYSLGKADGGWNGMGARDVRRESQVDDDWHFYEKGDTTKNFVLPGVDDPEGQGVPRWLNSLGTTRRFRYRNDNSKYMIFKKERTFFTHAPTFSQFNTNSQLADVINPTNLSDHSTNDFLSYNTDGSGGHTQFTNTDDADFNHTYYHNIRDPALTGNWIPYYEIKNVKIEPGFKSPEDIAEEVSRTLNQTTQTTEIYARVGERNAQIPFVGYDNSTYIPSARHEKIGIKKDGELFKTFYSTNHLHFSSDNAKQYFRADAGATANYPEKHPQNIRYMSAYHYIGVKRPELWNTGREFHRVSRNVSKTITWGESGEWKIHPGIPAGRKLGYATNSRPVITNIPWKFRHELMAFIKAQGQYPELFDYKYSNIKKAGSIFQNVVDVKEDNFQMGNSKTGKRLAGFIHFSLIKRNHAINVDTAGKIKSSYQTLGDDGYAQCFNTDYSVYGSGGSKPEQYEGFINTQGTGVNSGPTMRRGDSHLEEELSGNFPYYDLSSVPLWFYLDQSRIDVDDGGQDLSAHYTDLCFGCMKKYNPLREGDSDENIDYIAFDVATIGGLPDFFFQVNGNPTDTTFGEILDFNNYLGVDRHFSAYGTKCIMLYSGTLSGTQPDLSSGLIDLLADCNTQFNYMGQPGAMNMTIGIDASKIVKPEIEDLNDPGVITAGSTPVQLENVYQHHLNSYIGANSFQLVYDGDTEKRFSFQNLHTPEYIGNNFNAGSTATDPIAQDASDIVYKVNKRLSGANYCPEMQPYHTDITTTSTDSSNVKIKISTSNYNLGQWDSIYDAHSGCVFKFSDLSNIETLLKHWHKSLWGLLGFSFNQLHQDYSLDDEKSINIKNRLHFNSRLTPKDVAKTPFIMTNALIKSSDSSLYRANMYGAPLYTEQTPGFGGVYAGALHIAQKIDNLFGLTLNHPAITIQAESISVKADRQPTKMAKPYYLIKSNIVGNTDYIGNGNNGESGQGLPIIGVVNKENGFGDYYFQTDQKAVFTITSDTTLSEIVTSIHDPDMSFARVDKASAVLYMVQKTNNNNLNIIPTMIQQKLLNPQQLMTPVMTEAEFNSLFDTMVSTADQAEAERIGFALAHSLQSGLTEPINAERLRGLESFLGLITGEAPTTMIGQDVEPIPIQGMTADIVKQVEEEGAMTRARARELASIRQEILRAQLGLRNRFISSASRDGQNHTEPQLPTDLRGLDLELGLPTPRSEYSELTTQRSMRTDTSAGTEASKPSTIATAPSEPNDTPQKPVEP
jgi:hypothetical protein